MASQIIIPRRALTLNSSTRRVVIASVDVPALTSSIALHIKRPTTLNLLSWGNAATLKVAAVLEVDGIAEHVYTGRATGGIRLNRKGVEVDDYSLSFAPTYGFFGARDGFPKRLGETSKSFYRLRVELDALSGNLASEIEVLLETLAAPRVQFHSSVAFDAATSAQENAGDGVISLAHTSTGSDLGAFAGTGNSGGTPRECTSITWNGAMSEKWDTQGGSFHKAAGYTKAGQSTGSQTVTATLAGAPDEHVMITASFTGVDPTNPVGSAVTSTTNSQTPSVTVLSLDGAGMVVDFVYAGDGISSTTAGANQNERDEENLGNNMGSLSTQLSSDGGVMSWTFNATPGAGTVLGAIEFKPVVVVAAITGTATATIDEADVVAGGKTIIATLTGDTFVAASVTSAITQPASANGGTASTTSFSITLPTTAANDILILEFCHRGTGTGTIGGTSVSVGGLTWANKHSQNFATNTFSGQLYWTRATGNHSGQTVTGSSLTNSCAAIVKVKRGCVESGDPFTNAATIVGEANASGNETQAQITTLIDGAEVNLTILNSPDLAVATHACTSPGALGSEVEVLSTGGTDSSISSACAVKATAGATGSFTWTQTDAAGGSYAYALEPKVTTPFADARQAIIDGLDSAQSEAHGWNVEVRDKLAVTTVARTSSTVCTITLSAQAAYNITAQETITVTVPATALTGAAPITGSPTFTVDTDGGGGGGSILPLVACDMSNISDMGGMRG